MDENAQIEDSTIESELEKKEQDSKENDVIKEDDESVEVNEITPETTKNEKISPSPEVLSYITSLSRQKENVEHKFGVRFGKNRRIKDEFIKNFAKSMGNITSACIKTQIDRQTYYNWLKNDPEFAEACFMTEDYTLDFVQSKLMKLIDDMDRSSIQFYLKFKGKKRGYIDHSEIGIDDKRIDYKKAAMEELQHIVQGD